MPPLTLLVLAAGIGSRYKGLKQIDPVGPSGETILDYSLHDALHTGFSKVVFVIRKDIEAVFRQAIGSFWEKQAEAEYVFQEIPAGRQKPWGTGQAVLLCQAAIESPFAVINADDFYGPSAYSDLSAWLKAASPQPKKVSEYCFVGYQLRNTLSEFGYVSRGVCEVDRNGYLREVVERVRIERQGQAVRASDENGRWITLSGGEVVSMNFWGFTPALFAQLKEGFEKFLQKSGQDPGAEYYTPSAVNELVKSGQAKIKHLPTAERWFGVTYPQDVPLARARIRELVKKGIYPDKIRK